jgi:hypothetical protein
VVAVVAACAVVAVVAACAVVAVVAACAVVAAAVSSTSAESVGSAGAHWATRSSLAGGETRASCVGVVGWAGASSAGEASVSAGWLGGGSTSAYRRIVPPSASVVNVPQRCLTQLLHGQAWVCFA